MVMPAEDTHSGRSLPRYHLSADALEYGASFGNARCWLTTRGQGSIQQFFSTETGSVVTGSVSLAYGGAGHRILRAGEDKPTHFYSETDVQLRPLGPGTVGLHPAYPMRT